MCRMESERDLFVQYQFNIKKSSSLAVLACSGEAKPSTVQ